MYHSHPFRCKQAKAILATDLISVDWIKRRRRERRQQVTCNSINTHTDCSCQHCSSHPHIKPFPARRSDGVCHLRNRRITLLPLPTGTLARNCCQLFVFQCCSHLTDNYPKRINISTQIQRHIRCNISGAR